MTISLPFSKPLQLRPERLATPSGSRNSLPTNLVSSTGFSPTRHFDFSEPSSRLAETTTPEATEATTSLIPFAEHTHPRYQPAPHHHLIAEKLEAVERGEIDRLMIFMPPRMGKSELASIRFPAWCLGRHPERRIIGSSYAADLAYRFSRQARNIINDPRWPFPNVRLSADSASVKAWDIAGNTGGYIGAGVGGPITGAGAHLLIIDDPVKNAEEAGSQTYRDAVWEWYQSTAYTRLEDKGAVVLIQTRWHHDDLAGRLMLESERGGDQWVIVKLPAIDDDGGALWPEKYDVEALERIKGAVGSRAWTALYQQEPTDDAGAIIRREWWRSYRQLPEMDHVIQIWDTAFKAKETSDWSVCATWGSGSDGYYLIDLWRDRVTFPDLKRKAAMLYEQRRPDAVVIEDAASGQSLIQELKRETKIPIIAYKPDKDKVARVNAVTPIIEAGRAFLPESASWLAGFIEEHTQFPNGAHDDQVDTTSMALLRFQRQTSWQSARMVG